MEAEVRRLLENKKRSLLELKAELRETLKQGGKNYEEVEKELADIDTILKKL